MQITVLVWISHHTRCWMWVPPDSLSIFVQAWWLKPEANWFMLTAWCQLPRQLMANPKTKGFGRFKLDNLENGFLYNGQLLMQCEYVYLIQDSYTVYHVFAQKRRASRSMCIWLQAFRAIAISFYIHALKDLLWLKKCCPAVGKGVGRSPPQITWRKTMKSWPWISSQKPCSFNSILTSPSTNI